MAWSCEVVECRFRDHTRGQVDEAVRSVSEGCRVQGSDRERFSCGDRRGERTEHGGLHLLRAETEGRKRLRGAGHLDADVVEDDLPQRGPVARSGSWSPRDDRNGCRPCRIPRVPGDQNGRPNGLQRERRKRAASRAGSTGPAITPPPIKLASRQAIGSTSCRV